jgi:hypothetical protein
MENDDLTPFHSAIHESTICEICKQLPFEQTVKCDHVRLPSWKSMEKQKRNAEVAMIDPESLLPVTPATASVDGVVDDISSRDPNTETVDDDANIVLTPSDYANELDPDAAEFMTAFLESEKKIEAAAEALGLLTKGKENAKSPSSTPQESENSLLSAFSQGLSDILFAAEDALSSHPSPPHSPRNEGDKKGSIDPIYRANYEMIKGERRLVLEQAFSLLCSLGDTNREWFVPNRKFEAGKSFEGKRRWLHKTTVFGELLSADETPLYDSSFLESFDGIKRSEQNSQQFKKNVDSHLETIGSVNRCGKEYDIENSRESLEYFLKSDVNGTFKTLLDSSKEELGLAHLLLRLEKMKLCLLDALRDNEKLSLDPRFWKIALKTLRLSNGPRFGMTMKYIAVLLCKVGYQPPIEQEQTARKPDIHSTKNRRPLLLQEYL